MRTFAKTLVRPPAAAIVLRRLRTYADLDGAAEAFVHGLDDRQVYPAGTQIGGERGRMMRPRFVVAGWAARIRWLADGRRQILGFVLPGDAVGLGLDPRPLALAATVALTELQTIDASAALRGAPPPRLAEALRVAAAVDEALLIDQVVRLGRQTAYERICHLLLELSDRLEDVGLSHEGRFALPLTQEALADATGLSIVHVNRILQQLRRERLLDLRGGRAALLAVDRLRAAADYRRIPPSAWASADAVAAKNPPAPGPSGPGAGPASGISPVPPRA